MLAARRRLPASPPQNPCQGRLGRLCLFPPRQGGGHGDIRDARHNPLSPCLHIPPGKQPLPTLPPGPPSPERRRDQLLSGTGGSFVTLLLLSHAGASPSPSSRHRVPPHIPPTAPPRRRPRGQGATSASATGRRRYRQRGGGRSPGAPPGASPGYPERGHLG